eukprot:GILI01012081.1.p1 GENE.GILI01012081.1~~GILI01012081.1.p1  ORF type:complete len:386 (-),score=145.35 GILI01012081.1:67-1224(-)
MSDCRALSSRTDKLSVLRSLCLKAGVRLVAREVDFDQVGLPLSAADVADLVPVVHHVEPTSADARELFEQGKRMLAEGRFEAAYELLAQALGVFNQVTGPMFKETAVCYSSLAMIFYRINDFAQAVAHQEKAVIINERMLGLDHPDTIHAHGNLAHYLHAMGDHAKALLHMQRCLYLLELTAGAGHPETISTYVNIATMYQDLSLVELAIRFMAEALKRSEALWGADHPQVAQCHSSIARILATAGDFRQALQHTRLCWTIMLQRFGEQDVRTQEAALLMEQFTKLAVEAHKIETVKRVESAMEKKAKTATPLEISRMNDRTRAALLTRLRAIQSQMRSGRLNKHVTTNISDMQDAFRRAESEAAAAGASGPSDPLAEVLETPLV